MEFNLKKRKGVAKMKFLKLSGFLCIFAVLGFLMSGAAVAGTIDDPAATVTVNGLTAIVDIGQKTDAAEQSGCFLCFFLHLLLPGQ